MCDASCAALPLALPQTITVEATIVSLLPSDGDAKKGLILDLPDPLDRASWVDALQGHIDLLKSQFVPDVPADKTGMMKKQGHQW